MYGYNQFYNPQFQTQRPMEQPYQQFVGQQQFTPQYGQPKQQLGLQGKSVDNIEVVKATDIPLDGSISYFPLTDGSAIVTKQLQQDGTSKTIVYMPLNAEEESKKMPQYVTVEQLQEEIKKVDNGNLKEELKGIKRQIRDILDDLKDKKE